MFDTLLDLPVHPQLRHPLTGQPLRAVYVDKHGTPRWPIIGASEPAPEGGGSGGPGGSGSGSGGGSQGGQSGGQSGGGSGSGGAGQGGSGGGQAGGQSGGSGGSGGSGDGGNNGGAGGSGKENARDDEGRDLGFPKDTPIAEMDAKQEAAYWRHQSKKHEQRNREWLDAAGGKSAADLKAEREQREREQMTPAEQQLTDAKNQGREEALNEVRPQFVRMAFNTALAHIEKDEERQELIDTLDLTKFLDDKGNVDTGKVATVAQRLAPAGKGTGGQYDFGGGRRESGGGGAADVGGMKARMEKSLGRRPKQHQQQ